MTRRILSCSIAVASLALLGGSSQCKWSIPEEWKIPGVLGLENANVRLVHASPDTGRIDLCIDRFPFIRGVSFGAFSPYVLVGDGQDPVRAIVPGGSCGAAGLADGSFSFPLDTFHTLVLVNRRDGLEILHFSDDPSRPAAGLTRVRLINAALDVPAVDLVLQDGTRLFGGVSFKGNSGYRNRVYGSVPS